MQWGLVIALVITISIILFPAAFVWYLNIGGIYAAIKRVREKRAKAEQDEIVIVKTFGPTDIIS